MPDQNSSSAPDLKMVPPPNLPTATPPVVNIPPRPLVPPPPLRPLPPTGGIPSAPLPPRPATPVPPPVPRPTTPISPTPVSKDSGTSLAQREGNIGTGTPNFQSSVRTMQDDIVALKKGQAPAPMNLPSRPSEVPRPPVIAPVVPPLAVNRTQTNLGGMEKARTMAPTVLSPATGRVTAPSSVTGSKRHFSGAGLWLIVIVLLLGGLASWYFLYYQPNQAEQAMLTPIPTLTPRPKPPLETVFSSTNPVVVALSPDYFTTVKNTIDQNTLVFSDPLLYKPMLPGASADLPIERLTFSRFTAAILTTSPAALQSAVVDDQFYLTLMREGSGTVSQGFIVKLQSGSDIKATLTGWEATLGNDFQALFGIDSKRGAGKTFLDNNYQGTAIRYRNYPGPETTIDYAVVTAPDGDNYLVFANSKQHMFAVIDRIRMINGGFTPVPLSETPTPGK